MEAQEVFKNHPIYQNYSGSSFARVFNNKLKKYVVGTKNKAGYTLLRFVNEDKKEVRIVLHKFIYECFFGIVDSKIYHIDHINPNKSLDNYNYLCNLQKLTIKEHMIKTHSKKYHQQHDKITKKVFRIKIENGKEVERILFENAKNAALSVNVTNSTISKLYDCCNGRIDSFEGYKWEWDEIHVLEGEYWVCLLDPKFCKCQVSNLGRIRHDNCYGYGSPNSQGYLQKTINRKRYYVHYLVCVAFFGNPPTDKHTPDHIISSQITNNTINNLRWATPAEQNLNRECMRNVQALDRITGKIYKTWPSVTSAANELKLHKTHISAACNGKLKTSGGFKWRYIGNEQD